MDIAKAKHDLEKGGKVLRVGGKVMSMGGETSSKIVGNISSTQTLFRGSKEDIKEEVTKALDAGVDI